MKVPRGSGSSGREADSGRENVKTSLDGSEAEAEEYGQIKA
jgi:hypothetical protein